MHYLKTHFWLIVQAVIFLFVSLSFIIPSGNYSCVAGECGLRMGAWQLHDALWHISLAKLGFVSWPLQNPFIAGQSLASYNFLFDAILFGLFKLGISPFFSFFKLLPFLAAILYVFTVLAYVHFFGRGKLHNQLLVFFLFFGNGMSYLATLYKDHSLYYSSLRGFPVVTSVEPTTMFQNLQYSFSLSLLLWLLILLKKPFTKWTPLLYFFIFFLLFGFKFYAGVVGLLLVLPTLLRQAKSLIFSGLGSLLGLYIFYGLSNHSGFPFKFAPFALTHLMFDDSHLFYNHYLTLARYYLYDHPHMFSPRLWAIEGASILLFLLINFGTRLIGIFSGFKSAKYLNCVIILTALIPIFFVQDGGWYNTMQFLYYGVWLAGILTANYLYQVIKVHRFVGIILATILLPLTIPNDIEQLRLLTADQVVIDSGELKALAILQAAPPGVVSISDPIHKNGLVPALAEKYPYYLDTDQLMVTHADYVDRLAYLTKYSGGSITQVPADYYLIYKSDVGSNDALRALSHAQEYHVLYDSSELTLFQKVSGTIKK
jgi:hypothetical protein